MNAIQITNDLLDKKLTNKPYRYDMAINFYCCVEKDKKHYVLAYYYNPVWDLYYPFYDDINKNPVIQESKANTYKELIQETNQIIDIDLKVNLTLAHKRFEEVFGCRCKVKQSNIRELYELKYSKTTELYSIYKLFNFIITDVDDLDLILSPKNMKCKMFKLECLEDSTKLVSNAKWFCMEALEELKENSFKIKHK